MNRRAVGALAAAALLGGGCVTVPEFRNLERDVRTLKAGGGASSEATGTRLADLGEQVEALHDEIAQLRGEIEEVRFSAEQALKEARAARTAAPQGATISEPGSDAGSDAPSGRVGSAGPVAGEIKAYEEAFRSYRAADYPAAIDRFQGFLQTHASSEYADNALFWMGESYFKLGDHEQAAVTFDRVVKQFPEGNKVPDALYRQGIALVEIGNQSGQAKTYTPAARQVFQRIVREYPDSDRVPEAQRMLEKLVR